MQALGKLRWRETNRCRKRELGKCSLDTQQGTASLGHASFAAVSIPQAQGLIRLNGATLWVAKDAFEVQGRVEVVVVDPWPK